MPFKDCKLKRNRYLSKVK